MKIAITSTGNSLDSKIDSRFGRCAFFGIYDYTTQHIEFISNPNFDAVEGAGPASVQLVASQGVGKLVSVEFGQKVKTLTDRLKIELVLISDTNKTVKDIIELLTSNQQTNQSNNT
jgi:predicted Fe-Mo cluster-binding NifX family protein